ncbi:arginase family protein [Sulfoacidibacillus ferrooxidans]|uniref:Formimidoylglutamase n=1 Tax=Sulfoacidibacillus ferrooxidans TaxID=2005001 RepID=A0A9X2AE61_9BACL|nr:arginase family protein [Sulfoacidibacillus ferrooxidans]MCI0184225.1 Formimidoylglutamase [Sulfoacidibacillus ferrooxidans]
MGESRTKINLGVISFSSEDTKDMSYGPEKLIASTNLIPTFRIEESAPGVEGWMNVSRSFRITRNVHIDRSMPTLMIVGDCTSSVIGMSAVQFYHGKEAHLIWIDAHADFNTPDSSKSGFLGGMPLNALVGGCFPEVLSYAEISPIPASYVTLFGCRDIDPLEELLLQKYEVVRTSDVNSTLQRIKDVNRPVYLHFDTDVLSLDVNPAASYPSPGGLVLEEAFDLLQQILETNRVVVVTVSAYSPAYDKNNIGLRNISAIIQEIYERLSTHPMN